MSQPKEDIHIGTPFMDGVLAACQKHNLSEDQVAELLEKGAESKDARVSGEMRGFIDRVIAAQTK